MQAWATENGRRVWARKDINSPIRPGEIEGGYDYADSPRRWAGYGGWGDECEGKRVRRGERGGTGRLQRQ